MKKVIMIGVIVVITAVTTVTTVTTVTRDRKTLSFDSGRCVHGWWDYRYQCDLDGKNSDTWFNNNPAVQWMMKDRF